METGNEYTSPLLTDRYLLTMVYSFFKCGKHMQTAVYEFFFRKNPFQAQYTVLGGINETIAWLRQAKFSKEEVRFVQENLELDASDPFLDWLSKLEFSCLKAYAIEEGTFVFPYIPLLILEGPLGVVQLTETLILNKLNYPSLIATNARLLKNEIGDSRHLLEFGLRRAQGPDGATTGALYSYIGGAFATSNMQAGFKYGVPVIGTMAHSYVTSFASLKDLESQERTSEQKDFISLCQKTREELGIGNTHDGELAAFISFTWDFPNNLIFLIDTYHTLNSGLLNYIIVSLSLEKLGKKAKGVRLDSGNLAQLSVDARQILKSYGAKTGSDIENYTKIAASDDLSLSKIKEMKDKHSIDIFAVGTKLITCYEQAALGMVCKLCKLDEKPRIKNSETLEKSTLPDKKQAYRCRGTLDNQEIFFDVLALASEEIKNESEVELFIHQKYEASQSVKIIECSPLLHSIENNSDNFKFSPSESKKRVETNWEYFAEKLPEGQKRPLYITLKLKELLFELKAEIDKNSN